MMKSILLTLIRLYQKIARFLSPLLPLFFLTERLCRFSPTCSEYTYQAIEKYGVAHGLMLGIKRIVRCTPWNKGGFDPLA